MKEWSTVERRQPWLNYGRGFWIVRGRQYIRSVIYQCVACRKQEGEPYRAPPPPPLPECRVKEDFPFANTGVDFAGPLYVKNPDSKVWISLYTCCVTRAVHLDLVPDMSTEAFLRNFQRFCARRGVPSLVISDNAKPSNRLRGSLCPYLNAQE